MAKLAQTEMTSYIAKQMNLQALGLHRWLEPLELAQIPCAAWCFCHIYSPPYAWALCKADQQCSSLSFSPAPAISISIYEIPLLYFNRHGCSGCKGQLDQTLGRADLTLQSTFLKTNARWRVNLARWRVKCTYVCVYRYVIQIGMCIHINSIFNIHV